MKKTWKSLTASLLSLAMVIVMLPGIKAQAAGNVTQKGIKSTSITVKWNAPNVGTWTINNYKVYAGKDYNSVKLVATLSPNQTTYTLKKLKAGAIRTFKITYDYTNTYGSQYTSILGTLYDAVTIPGKVTGLKEETWYHSINKVYINWKQISSATGYQYKFFRNNGKTRDSGTTNYRSSVSASSAKVTNSEVYTAKVRAFTEFNGKKYFGAWSAPLYLVPQAQISKLKTTTKKMTVKWGRVSGATSYNIYISTNKNKGYKKVKTIKATKKDKKAITATIKKKFSKSKKYYVYVQTVKKVKKKNYTSKIYNYWYNI